MFGTRFRILVQPVLAPEVRRDVDISQINWFDWLQFRRFKDIRSLVPLFRPDLIWWAALFVLCLILVAPLALVDVPPLLDYPNHLARAYVLAHGQADVHLSQMYAAHWTIIPNLAIDLILPPLLLIMPVHIAGRILLAVALVLPVVGTILYSRAVFAQRSYWPLAACLVACNGLFLLGFINFQLGIGLALACAAAWRRVRESRPMGAMVLGIASAVILFFSHLMGLLFFLIILLSHEIERVRIDQQPGRWLVSSLLRTAWSIPIFLIPIMLYGSSAFGDKAFDVSWEIGSAKLIRSAMSVVNYNFTLDIVTACFIAVVLLTLAMLRLVVVPLGSIIVLVAIGVLFMVSPFSFKGTGYVDARFAVMFGFLLFGTILPARLSKKSAFFVGFAILALYGVRTAQIAAIWNAHNRDLDQFRSAMSVIEPGSRVLLAAVSTEEAGPAQHELLQHQYLSDGSRLDAHTAALLLIERHAFWPFLFANPEQQPVALRPPYAEIAERTVGIPDVRLLSASEPKPGDVERFPLVGQWSCCYDYVLLMEAGSWPGFHHDNLKLLYQSDYASMFRIIHHAMPASDLHAQDYVVTTSQAPTSITGANP
jgi:hypothetical protein